MEQLSQWPGLSPNMLNIINEQFERLFLDLHLTIVPKKVDHGSYYFLGNYRFGLAYLLSTVWEEAEHSAPEALTIAQDLCISLWKELRLLNAKHKELHDTLRGLLDQYFTEVPSTFLASAKAKLVPESIQLIRCIVTSLTDEESETFPEWIRQYYTFHEDGNIISGFRGLSLTQDCTKLAVFVNKTAFQIDGNFFGLDKAKRMHLHIVIHELIHLQSFKAKGGATWEQYLTITPRDPRPKIDEGFTETFTRIIVYRMIKEGITCDGLTPMLKEQGEPVYECLKEIGMVFVKDLGLHVCAKAFFEGEWQTFTDKLQILPRYQQEQFWKSYHVISHTAAVFRGQGERVQELIACGVPLQMPDQLHKDFQEGNWEDSVLGLLPELDNK